jgi:hypothetical protein
VWFADVSGCKILIVKILVAKSLFCAVCGPVWLQAIDCKSLGRKIFVINILTSIGLQLPKKQKAAHGAAVFPGY